MRVLLFLATALLAFGQNSALTGSYYFRHVQLDTSGASVDMRSAAGTITFNGSGGFTYTAQQLVNFNAPAALNGTNGTYTLKPGGVLTLTNPQRTSVTINARLGTGAIVGASTEAGTSIFDLFIAIPASTSATNARLTGPYYVSSLEFPGSVGNVRNTNFKLTANGTGAFAENAIYGQSRSANNKLTTQTLTSPITYSVASDSTGTLTFPLNAGAVETSQLISGTKTIYVSPDGNYFIGGSLSTGSHGMVVGVKAFANGATNSSFDKFFYGASLRLDIDRTRYTSTTSAVNATPGGAVFGRRVRQSDGLFDASVFSTYALGPDGSGYFTSTTGRLNLGATGNVFTISGVDEVDSNTYELSFGIRMPSSTGTGVFIDPQRVLNGASFALGQPISPGGFVTLFGSGLGPATPAVARTLPFPTQLGGVRVTVNGKAAPLYLAASGQISLVVPYSTTGTTATIVVTYNGATSNTVEVPLAPTAPGIFSLTQNGIGDAAVLHANFTAVTADNPAVVGEILQVFLSGLGAVTPTVVEGAAAPSNPTAKVIAPLAITIGGKSVPASDIFFQGLAPTLAGLYQLNVRVPVGVIPGAASLAIQTLDGFTDQVSIRIR